MMKIKERRKGGKKEGKERTEEGRKKERSALLNSQDQMQMILL